MKKTFAILALLLLAVQTFSSVTVNSNNNNGYAPNGYQQYNNQPYNNQPYNNQPYNNQYNNQYNQPYNNQPYSRPTYQRGGTLGKDLIINGGFEQNKCPWNWCVWHKYYFQPEYLVGWTTDTYIEIGKNTIYYRPSVGSGFVALVEAYRQIFPRQKIALTAGKYMLNFDWVSRYAPIYGTVNLEVKYNGKCLKSIRLDDDKCLTEDIEFILDTDVPDGELKFSIDGYTCYGVLIDNVKLRKYE